jgi:hypothetical protein
MKMDETATHGPLKGVSLKLYDGRGELNVGCLGFVTALFYLPGKLWD